MTLQTRRDNLDTAIDNLIAEIATVSAHQGPYFTLPPGPTGQGQTLDKTRYLESLRKQLKDTIELRQIIDEPFMRKHRLGCGRRCG